MKTKLNIHPSKIFYGYLYPIYAKDFIFGNDYEKFTDLIQNDFDLTAEQWDAVLIAWEQKEEILSK